MNELESETSLLIFISHFCVVTGSGNPDPAMLNRYRLGYSECINEVSRFLTSSESAVPLRTQLIGHLANCCNMQATNGAPHQQPQQQQTVAYTPAPPPAPVVPPAAMGPTTAPPTSQSIQVQIAPSPVATTTAVPTKVEMASPTGNVSARVVSGIPVANVPGAITTGEITVVLPSQAFPGGQLPSHFIPVYAQNAPMLSPASSTSSQCLASPTSSAPAETPMQQTVSYQYQQVPKQELPSPTTYEQQHQQQAAAPVPQTVSYLPGIATSPLMGSIAPTSTTVQAPAPTLVAMPANVLTPAPEPSPATVQQQQHHHVPVSQPHVYHQSPPKTVLRTVNINVHQQQQCATEDENVWRPW